MTNAKDLLELGKSFENEFPVSGGIIIEAANRLTELEAIAEVQNSALTAVTHDRPSAHTDGIWLQVNQAIDTYNEWKAKQ